MRMALIKKTDPIVRRYPYFIRSTLVIRADEWESLRDEIDCLRSSIALTAPTAEIKWSHLWQLKRFENRDAKVGPKHAPAFLHNCSFSEALHYVEESLKALQGLGYARVILTVTDTGRCQRIAEANLYKMHLQEAMQRIEMELDNTNDICVVLLTQFHPSKTDICAMRTTESTAMATLLSDIATSWTA